MIRPELCSTRYFSLLTRQHSLVGILSNMAHRTGDGLVFITDITPTFITGLKA